MFESHTFLGSKSFRLAPKSRYKPWTARTPTAFQRFDGSQLRSVSDFSRLAIYSRVTEATARTLTAFHRFDGSQCHSVSDIPRLAPAPRFKDAHGSQRAPGSSCQRLAILSRFIQCAARTLSTSQGLYGSQTPSGSTLLRLARALRINQTSARNRTSYQPCFSSQVVDVSSLIRLAYRARLTRLAAICLRQESATCVRVGLSHKAGRSLTPRSPSSGSRHAPETSWRLSFAPSLQHARLDTIP